MRVVPNAISVIFGAGLLALMLATLPDYASTIRPFVIDAGTNGKAEGRLFDARFTGWQIAKKLAFEQSGEQVERDTAERFLIGEVEVTGKAKSTLAEAVWQGASGRKYAATKRASNAPRSLDTNWLQPGLTDKRRVVFELPEDEISGGKLILSSGGSQAFDSALHLAPPATMPSLIQTAILKP